MRYEDSHTGAFQGSGPVANDDLDAVAAGSHSSTTGNLITGQGTQTGSAGADMAAGAHITAVAGKGGEDTSFSGGKLSVSGEHGKLSVDAEGNYSYQANAGIENVRDRFTYTLANNQGATDSASLTIEIGKTPVVIKANAQQIVPGPDGVVTLPPGVELSDIRVVGRNLVIDMPDGTQLIIVDGAVFVPQLVLGGVEVPATNVAALLVGQEIQPAAGETTTSSGGNFDVPVPPLDPGVPLGDLIPPTEYVYVPPEPQEVDNAVDREPTITIQPDGQPATVAAIDSVDEDGLPTRNGGEPAGSDEIADGNPSNNSDPDEATGGLILYDSPDGFDSITINGVVITSVGQVISGAFGTLVITSIAGGQIGYTYTLADNMSGDNVHDDFAVVLTDNDGDTATATLTIDIIDDVPTARPDTDSIPLGSNGSATGNVITDAAPGDVGDSDTNAADTVGADNATVTFVDSVDAAPGANVPNGGFVDIEGQYGTLRIYSNGDYSYIRGEGPPPGAVQDIFNYTLTDGDGDTSTSTLTISITDFGTTVDAPDQGEAGTVISEVGLPERNGSEPAGSGEIADGNGTDNDDTSETTTGVINFSAPDGLGTVTINGAVVTGAVGQIFAGTYGTLTITSYNAGTGQIGYSYTLADNTSGNNSSDDFAIIVSDANGDASNDTLVINIVDDVPTANNDTDSLAAGTFGPETGNVITGVGATSGAAGDDIVGADNALVTAVVGFGGSSDNLFNGGVLEVNGQYGVLTIDADGNYSYTRSPGTPAGVQDVFTYTLTDGDGDSDTATLTIDIGNAVPQTGENPTVLLDDDALANGNPGGTSDDPDSANVAGTLSGSGGDGALTFVVLLTGEPAGFDYVSGGAGVVLIQQGGETKLTVTVNPDGSYTVVQNNPIEHAPGADENNVQFTINYTVTDVDGDSASGSFNINVDDDRPIALEGQVTGTVDEDGVPGGIAGGVGDVAGESAVANGSVASLFASGADTPLSYSLLSDTSGLPALTSGGVAVTYEVVGDTLTASAGGSTVFTFVLNVNGSYTFTLVSQLDHMAGGDENDLGIALGSIIQATDNDGDSVTANANGLVITVDDDTPTASETLLTDTVDEDGVPGGIAGGPDDVTGAATVANGNVASLFNSGADAPLIFSLLADTSGLQVLSSGGVAVTYAVVGNMLTASAGGNMVFTFLLNADGSYTFTLVDQIDHPTLNGLPGDDIENDLNISLGSIIQATDADGDSVTANADGLTIIVDDDTPVANNDIDSIVGGNGPATGNVITGVDGGGGDANGTDGTADQSGADAPATITAVSSNNVPGNVDTDAGPNFQIAGEFGVLTLNADGSYSYLLNEGTASGVNDVFTYTLTDADGDSVTATLTIGIQDNFPTAGNVNAVVDDDDVVGASGNPSGPNDGAPSNASGNLPGSGGGGTLTWDLLLMGAPAGFTYQNGANGSVEVFQGATKVLTITINSATGAYTITENAPIVHPSLDGLAGDNSENNVSFAINYTVTDADGDPANGTLNISVDDDTPIATATLLTGTVDEDGVLEGAADAGQGDGIAGGIGDVAGQNVVASGSVATLFSSGADGPLTYSLLTNTGGLPALTSGGVAVTYAVVGDTLTASAGGNTVFTFVLNADGSYTFTLVNQLDHAAGGNENDLSIALGSIIQATDNDGDSVTANANGLVITVDDDSPIATQTLLTGTVDEDGVVEGTADAGPGDGIAGGVGDVAGQNIVASGNVAPLFQSGADELLTYSLSNSFGGLPALASNSVAVTYSVGFAAGVYTLTALAGAETVFTFTLNASTGAYQFILVDQLDHANGLNENDLAIALGSIIQATDFDGDAVTANSNGLVITVDDDSPTLGTIQDQSASNVAGDPVSTGTLHFEVGADGPATVSAITADNNGITSSGKALVTNVVGNVLTAYQDANNSGAYDAGDTTAVYTLTVNPNASTSGQYVFDLVTPLDPTVTSVPIGGSSSFGAGPTGFQVLQSPGGEDLCVVSGYHMQAGFNEATWLATGTTAAANYGSAGVNGSTAGWGVDNNNFEGTNELFVWDFGSQATRDPDAGGPFVPPVQGPDVAGFPPEVQMPNISFAEYDFINYTAADDIKYVVHFTDGSFVSGTIPGVNLAAAGPNWIFTAPAGKFIADLEMFASGTAPGKVDLVNVGVQSSSLNETIDFNVTLSDHDGDTVSGGFSVDVSDSKAAGAPESLVLQPQGEQLQKTVANSNTLFLAAAIAAAGVVKTQAAAAPAHDNGNHHHVAELDSGVSHQVSASVAKDSDSGGLAVTNEASVSAEDSAPAASSSGRSSAPEELAHALDGSSAKAAVESCDHPTAASDQGPASSPVTASPVAPLVGVPSAEALQATGLTAHGGHAQHSGSVEQIIVEALGHGNAPATVDALLNALPSGNDQVAANANVASPAAVAVPAWDMSMHGAFNTGHDMMFKMGAEMLHHDAVQPVVNG